MHIEINIPLDKLTEDGIAAIGIAVAVSMGVGLILFLCCHIFRSMGLYSIAKRRGLKNPWLAWIPVGAMWTLGEISDQYQSMTRNKKTNRKVSLLILGILTAVLSAAVFTGMYSFVCRIGDMIGVNSFREILSLESMKMLAKVDMMELLTHIIFMGIGSLVLVVTGICMAVFQYIALYDLFSSCDPDTKQVFLVLGIVLNVTVPFLVFADRNKDNGMPPRRVAEQSRL